MAELLVVDCSVAAKWILPEPGRGEALTLLERWGSGSVTLIAPDLLMAEFASLLAKRRRRAHLTAEQCAQAYQLMRRCCPRLYETVPKIPRALELSLTTQLSFWDCVYLTLANDMDCAMVTADSRLVRGGARLGRVMSL